MSDTVTYNTIGSLDGEVYYGRPSKTSDNHGNKSFGRTITCSDGSVVQRTNDEFRGDARAIKAAGTGEGIFHNPLDGYTFELGALPSPLQTRCQQAQTDELIAGK